MNMKAILLSTVLAIGTHSALGQSAAKGAANSSPALLPFQTQALAQGIEAQEQRSLLRHCRTMAEVARGHTSELLHSATHVRLERDEIQQHLREVRSAVNEMFDDHKRLLYSLTDEQWAAAKTTITALEQLRADIQVQIEGIDLELQMPTPNPQVFSRYSKKLRTLLQDWRKQHQKMATAIGTKL